MQITKPTKAEVTRELRDYVFITFGLISYALGWAAFLIPYQITTGGTTGIGAIIYYATGFPIQWSYFIINAILMTFAIKILGPKFSIKTTYAIFGLTFLLWFFQLLVNGADGVPPQILGPGQDFMACLIGATMCGIGLGIVFNCNGSTGGTDIIAAIIHKYHDVTLGRMVMACDIVIISIGCACLQTPVDRNIPDGERHRPECVHLAKFRHRRIWRRIRPTESEVVIQASHKYKGDIQ